MKKVIKAIFFVSICLMIFYFSSNDGGNSQSTSDGLLIKLYPLYSLVGKASLEDYILKYGNLIRKMAHFFEFFVLGIVTYLFMNEFFNKYTFLISMTFVLIYAISDEVHQLFIPGRSGQLSDVLLDFMAASLAIILLHLLNKKKCQKESSL